MKIYFFQSKKEVYAQAEQEGRAQIVSLYDRCEPQQACTAAVLTPRRDATPTHDDMTALFALFESPQDASDFIHSQARHLTDNGISVTIHPLSPSLEELRREYIRRSMSRN